MNALIQIATADNADTDGIGKGTTTASVTGPYLSQKRACDAVLARKLEQGRREPTGWLEIKGIQHRTLRDLDARFPLGVLAAVTGPSGCGKTSLLRIIAGLEKTDSGSVIFDGKDLSRIPPHRRGFGMMFQDFSLFHGLRDLAPRRRTGTAR